jgi:hypothetical protein
LPQEIDALHVHPRRLKDPVGALLLVLVGHQQAHSFASGKHARHLGKSVMDRRQFTRKVGPMMREGHRAHTTLALEYYLVPSITIKKVRLRQEWGYQGGDRYHPGTWMLAGPFPPFP